MVALALLIFFLAQPDEDTPSPTPTQSPQAAAEIDDSPWIIGGEDTSDPLIRPHEVLNLTIPDSALVLESVGQYTGPNIEDGQDTPSANAASIVMRNDSDKTLQYAHLILQAGEQTVEFKITTLPPGARTQAIALDGQEYQPNVTYTYVSCETAYQDVGGEWEELFAVSGETGALTLTNLTEERYETVWVYYKYKQDSMYLGGITYRCAFQDVGPGETLTQSTGHYDPAGSEIMMVDTN